MLHRDKFSPKAEMDNVAMVKVTGEARGKIQHIPWNEDNVPVIASTILILASVFCAISSAFISAMSSSMSGELRSFFRAETKKK